MEKNATSTLMTEKAVIVRKGLATGKRVRVNTAVSKYSLPVLICGLRDLRVQTVQS